MILSIIRSVCCFYGVFEDSKRGIALSIFGAAMIIYSGMRVV
jgi:hypothetical protein